jgi:hypothetical protein
MNAFGTFHVSGERIYYMGTIVDMISPRDFYYSLPDRPKISHEMSSTDALASYSYHQDLIKISFSEYENYELYWAAIFHELSHKLFYNYQLQNNITVGVDDAKPFSELVAETGSAFLCEFTGIYDTTMDDHISYISLWRFMLNDQTLLQAVVTSVVEMMMGLLNRPLYWCDLPIEVAALIL